MRLVLQLHVPYLKYLNNGSRFSINRRDKKGGERYEILWLWISTKSCICIIQYPVVRVSLFGLFSGTRLSPVARDELINLGCQTDTSIG